jgi:hypothetical protein
VRYRQSNTSREPADIASESAQPLLANLSSSSSLFSSKQPLPPYALASIAPGRSSELLMTFGFSQRV